MSANETLRGLNPEDSEGNAGTSHVYDEDTPPEWIQRGRKGGWP